MEHASLGGYEITANYIYIPPLCQTGNNSLQTYVLNST